MSRTFVWVFVFALLTFWGKAPSERLSVLLFANGYLLSALLIRLKQERYLLLLPAFFAHLVAGEIMNMPHLLNFSYACAHVLSSLAGAELVRPPDGTRITLRSLNETAQLILNAGLVSSILHTLLVLPAHVLLHTPESAVMTCFLLFSSQMLGVLLITPILLTWKSSLISATTWQWKLEGVLLVLGTLLIQPLIYHVIPHLRPNAPPMPIIATPFLLWAIVRRTHTAVAFVLAIMGVVLQFEAVFNPELFALLGENITTSLYTLNTHLILTAITIHFLAALLNERHEVAEVEHASHEQLMRLNQVANQLASASSFATFCQIAVELGQKELGFDRLSLWLYDRSQGRMRGSYGIDEQGNLREEWGESYSVEYTWFEEQFKKEMHGFRFNPNAPIYNEKSENIGQGEVAMAILWDGSAGVGTISVDNFIHKRSISPSQQRLIQLYATTIGHLCSRIHIEEALRDSTQRLQEQSDILTQTQETAHIGGWIFYLDSQALHCTDEVYRIFERPEQEEIPTLEDLVEPLMEADCIQLLCAIEQAKENGIGWDFEVEAHTRTGKRLWLRTQGTVDRESADAPRIYGSFQDITERKRLEHETEELFTLSQDIFCLLNTEGQILRVNPAGVRISGYSESELLQRYIQDLIDPADFPIIEQEIEQFLAKHTLVNTELRLVCKDGSLRWLQWRSTPLIEGRVFYAVARDVTEQRNAYLVLRESESRFRDVTEAAGEYIWETGLDSRYTFLTERACAITGYSLSELLGHKPSDFMPLEEKERVTKWFKPYEEAFLPFRDLEHQTITKSGAIITQSINGVPRFDAHGNFLGWRGTGMDITAHKNLQEQVYQSQKMESIGRLAGGVAHDFNNLLTAIRGYTEMATDILDETHPAKRYLQNVELASDRATQLTAQLLAFARKQIIEPRIVDLRQQMQEFRDIVARLIGEDIRISLYADADLWQVKIDPGQFEQIVVNLAVNARDAMPQGGRLTLSLFNRSLSITEPMVSARDIAAGDYVHFMVQDTGMGMEEEVRRHIFEPFFTTKAPGRGTGLGMATCHGIVKQHEGHIWVQSEVGHGTTFHIYLPRVSSPLSTAEEEVLSPLRGGEERILLVEDEASVRDIAQRVLEQQGYLVSSASNGSEALELFQSAQTPFDLVLTDVIMPEMSGKQLVERLQAEQPLIKILYTSGYTGDMLDKQEIDEEGVAFLPKPYTPQVLARKVREVLDEKE
jgi:PAS domain S-box-containing protein